MQSSSGGRKYLTQLCKAFACKPNLVSLLNHMIAEATIRLDGNRWKGHFSKLFYVVYEAIKSRGHWDICAWGVLICLLFSLSCTERGDAYEWLCRLADPRHPQRHQPPDAQGEDPHGGAFYEGGARQKACSMGQPQPGQLHLPIVSQWESTTAPLTAHL